MNLDNFIKHTIYLYTNITFINELLFNKMLKKLDKIKNKFYIRF